MNHPLRVVIVTHKRPDLLARTLGFLGACRLPDCYAGTIVVENGGRAGAEAVVAQASPGLQLTYHYQPLPSKSRALNDALARAAESFVVFIDDDVRVDPGFVLAYADAAGRYGAGSFFGGPLHIDYEQEPHEWLKPHLPKSVRGWSLPAFDDRIERPAFSGGNWAAWAADLVRCGGFDERLGPEATRAVGEDTSMQAALIRAGGRGVYLPDAHLWHYVPRERCSPGWALRRAYRHAFRSGYDFHDATPRLFGFPRWMIREGIRRYFKAAWARLTCDPEAAFLRWLDYWKMRGLMMGVKQSAAEPAPSVGLTSSEPCLVPLPGSPVSGPSGGIGHGPVDR